MQQATQESIILAVNTLKKANRILITAGAGMGVDSGLPDFRGSSGFWKTYKNFRGKFHFTDCANPAFLQEHPAYFWGFYGHRLHLYRDTEPHQGFQILKEIVNLPNVKDYFVVTSNVDGHFQKAGFPENKVYEVHGSINYLQCSKCNTVTSAEKTTVKYDPETFEAFPPLPQCIDCKDVLRPNILMFNDGEWNHQRSHDQETEFYKFKNKFEEGDNVVVLELGAGEAVATIRYISESHRRQVKNCWLIRINPRDLKLSGGYYGKSFNENEERYIPIKETGLKALTEIRQELLKN